MSVENQIGEQEIAVKQEGTQKPSNMNGQSSDNSETMENLPSSRSTPSVPIIENFIEKESSLAGKNDARDWMESIGGIERTCALAFVDKTFLAAFLSFASWSKSPSTTSGGNHKQIDWTETVDIDAFINSMLERPGEIFSDPSAEHNRAENEESVVTNSLADANGEKRETGDLVDSNALRIHGEGISDTEEFDLRNINVISRLFDDTSLVFPSAFRQFYSEFSDEQSPAVVVAHRFDETDWQQAFSALDQVFTHFFGSVFLTDVDFSQTSPESMLISRLELLKQMRTQVPLALIFLVRLEVAAAFSFKDVSSTRHDTVPRLRTLLPQLLSNATILASRSLDESCMDPFLSAFCVPSDVSVDINALLLPPLSLLSFAKRNRGYDWVTLDLAIGSSLHEMETPVAVGEQTGICPSNGTESEQRQALQLEGPESNTEDSAPIQQKKKRKSRKRKGMKKISQVTKVVEPGDVVTAGEISDVIETTQETPLNDSKIPVQSSTMQASPVLDKHKVTEATDVAEASVSLKTVLSTESEQALDISDSNEKEVSAEIRSNIAAPEMLGLPSAQQADNGEDDEDAWERVEVRGRGNRRKGTDQQVGTPKNRPHGGGTEGGTKKTKGARSVASRKKVANRKVAKDILSSVLDKVEDEVQNKKTTGSKQPDNPWKLSNAVQSTRLDAKVPLHTPATKMTPPREKTLRDVLLGSQESTVKVIQPAGLPNNSSLARKDQNARVKVSSNKADKDLILADQNTAPTYQETISAVSTPSNIATKDDRNSTEDRASKSDSSVDETNETPPNNGRLATQPKLGASSDDPPLPTLLNPENANSTTSSVASSLEIPSGCHRHHAGSGDVNDVGYHLLDVCDQLSRDMCLFMSRRALALGARRRERGAILYALQDMLSRIWPNSCHVEMYGSCATQLDLPSSDIDVVIMGLDRNLMLHAPPLTGTNDTPSESPTKDRSSHSSKDDASSANGIHLKSQVQHHQLHPYPPFIPLPIQSNADRVRRLAAELELQPWAVQVNAIPTASVPVVKVLCDPSRLVGGSNSGEWMAHHQHLAADAAAAAGHSCEDGTIEEESESAPPQTSSPQAMLPWRGSDVMNGLLKLDITFEGPEHGGIGSTQFSARVVNDACQQANVPPDATSLVQVVMVLKELLVQRKLNEPYSGGLSSYALLLLVVALLREREVIRKEIEKVELQRKAMVEGDATASFSNPGERKDAYAPNGITKAEPRTFLKSGHQAVKPDTNSSRKLKANASHGNQAPKLSNEKSSENGAGISAETRRGVQTGSSSWASVAKKNPRPAPYRQPDSIGKPAGDSTSSAAREASTSTKATFADALSKPAVSTPTTTEKVSEVALKTSRGGPASLDDKRLRTSTSASIAKAAQSAIQSASKDEESRSKAQLKPESDAIDPSIIQGSSYFAQGFNDIVEVLCSGETTAGKLLMHFLLYYGEHFDAQSTAIDISGKHERSFSNNLLPYAHISPYIQRRAHGSIDPITGMLTVDPIVIFDPLEGAENTNVARRCFAWNSVRWIFAQSYNTLSSAVERSASPTTPNTKHTADARGDINDTKPRASSTVNSDVSNDPTDPSSPLLRCLLSF